jgi:two-component system nitrate/nitrite response regulator NarL
MRHREGLGTNDVYLRTFVVAEDCDLFTVQIVLDMMKEVAQRGPLKVCLLSDHAFVLSEMDRVLNNSAFELIPLQFKSALGQDLRDIQVPKALVYVVDAHVAPSAIRALVSNILCHYAEARIIVLAEKIDSGKSYLLLQMGAKGLLTYEQVQEQLPTALPLVAKGGFWVPRAVLSGFVESILGGPHRRELTAISSANLSLREDEVLGSLLENLSNKEIGIKLNITERTVKFHVSNVLNKFGVRRRADLIVHCYQRYSAPT